jgi:hypothetical protein
MNEDVIFYDIMPKNQAWFCGSKRLAMVMVVRVWTWTAESIKYGILTGFIHQL